MRSSAFNPAGSLSLVRRSIRDIFAHLRRDLSNRFRLLGLWVLLAYTLCFFYLVVALLTFRDYGITWDESWQSTYGGYILKWYASLFRDTHALEYWILIYYGGFFTTIAQAIAKVSPLGTFETRHLVGAFLGLGGVIGSYKLGKYLAGPLAGFMAALVLVLTPSFYGQVFNDSVDIPFASLFVLSVYWIVVSVRHFPRLPTDLILKLGVAIGLAMGVRVAGIILWGYIGLAFGLWTIRQFYLRSEFVSNIAQYGSSLKTFAPRYLAIIALSYILMLVWWPWAQLQPIMRPLEAIWFSSHFPWPATVLFEGKQILAAELPWYYLVKSFLLTLPEFYFFAFATGLYLFAVTLARHRLPHNNSVVECSLLVIFIVFPLVLQVVSHAVVYDGARHFSFILPMLAVLASVAVAKIVEGPRVRPVAVVALTIIIVSMATTLLDMVQLYPDEYIFFNRVFAGGLEKASHSYETEYWGNTYKEGAQWITQNYKDRGESGKIKVASCGFPLSTEYFLPQHQFEYLGSLNYGEDERPRLFLATTRWNCDRKLEGTIVHTIMRQGTPLLYIKEISSDP